LLTIEADMKPNQVLSFRQAQAVVVHGASLPSSRSIRLTRGVLFMFCNKLMAAASTAAMVASAPALAVPGGGANGGARMGAGTNMAGPSQAAIGARANSEGAFNASSQGLTRSNENSALHTRTTTTAPTTSNTDMTRATNSQGLKHASPTGIAHANSNSVLARGAVSSTALPGLTTGMTVQSSTGTSIGTVSQVITGTDGSIRAVVVTSPTGQTMRLVPNMLTISGGVVTTTSSG
jgi:hypothetical protein